MKGSLISPNEIMILLHENTEKDFRHTTYREEMKRFHLLQQGDMRAVEEAVHIQDSDLQGKLSDDELRNYRYLFIVNTGLATRFVIEAGVPQETVYAISDLYIQKADRAYSKTQITELTREIWTRYVELVRDSHNRTAYSKPVMACLDHISTHINEKITLRSLADEAGMNPCYLATLFRKEVGESVGEYILSLRINTAKALLTRTDYSYSSIALSLAFCSQSYFTKTFRERTGMTPRQYRMRYYNSGISLRSPEGS